MKTQARDIEFRPMILRIVSVGLMLAMVLPMHAAVVSATFSVDSNFLYVSDHLRYEGARHATLLRLGSAHLLLLLTLARNLHCCGDEERGVC